MTFLYWNISILLSFYCVSLAVADAAGELPAPVNPQIFWMSEFCPIMNWTRPHISDTCVVNYTIDTKCRGPKQQGCSDHHISLSGTSAALSCMSREKGIDFTITTNSNCKNRSQPVNLAVPQQPEVVKDFVCGFYSIRDINCTWLPSDNITNLQSYYGSMRPHGLVPQPCPMVMERGSHLIGCHLNLSHQSHSQDVYFLINGTRGNSVLTSTFKRKLLFKPTPPEVTINLTSPETLRFSWDPPDFGDDFLQCFKYELTYSECGETQKTVPIAETSWSVAYAPKCRYSVRVKIIVPVSGCGEGESEPSQVKYYEPSDGSTNVVLILAVISVGVLGFFCVLLFFFFHKYKDKLLPKIPEPSLGGSVRGMMELLYVPVKEEVEISLEVYPNN